MSTEGCLANELDGISQKMLYGMFARCREPGAYGVVVRQRQDRDGGQGRARGRERDRQQAGGVQAAERPTQHHVQVPGEQH